MALKGPIYLEMGDSSLVAVRAVAAAIKGEHLDPFEISPIERVFGKWLNKRPKEQRKKILSSLAGRRGVSKKFASKVDEDEILRWAVSLYENSKQYDGVFVGAPNGAVAHLATLLRFPFLTQHYLLGFKGEYKPDDTRAQFEDGCESARKVLANNPHLEAIIHYDPLHDRFLIKKINYVRIKLKRLPPRYREFIKKKIRPGGTVVSIECSYPWLRYPVKTDSGDLYYQVGGLGDVTPEEYIEDSERLKEYRGREGGDPDSPWGLKDIEPESGPESEWGSVENLAGELKEFCDEEGYRLVRIDYPHPEDFSLLSFRAYKAALELSGEKMERVFFDSFTHIDPRLNILTHAPSVWLPFICGDSYRFAEKVAKDLPKKTDIWLSLHPSFCDPVDLTPIEDWKKLFARFNSFELVGVDENKYPADLSTYVEFSRETKRLASLHAKRFALAIDPDILLSLIEHRQPAA